MICEFGGGSASSSLCAVESYPTTESDDEIGRNSEEHPSSAKNAERRSSNGRIAGILCVLVSIIRKFRLEKRYFDDSNFSCFVIGDRYNRRIQRGFGHDRVDTRVKGASLHDTCFAKGVGDEITRQAAQY